MCFNQVLKTIQIRETYLSLSPTHGSWNVDKAALIEMRPTIRTARGHVEPVTLCWEQINGCMYVCKYLQLILYCLIFYYDMYNIEKKNPTIQIPAWQLNITYLSDRQYTGHFDYLTIIYCNYINAAVIFFYWLLIIFIILIISSNRQ